MTDMKEGGPRPGRALLRRAAAWPHALAVVGVITALAALGQTIGTTVLLADAASQRPFAMPGVTAALYGLPLGLLALATTVPLIFLRPVAAAVAVTVAAALSLVSFGLGTTQGMTPGWMTAGGVAAVVIAVYRAGSSDSPPGRYVALILSVPFIVLAVVSRGGAAGVVLAALVPLAAGTGIAVRSGRDSSRESMTRTELAESLVEHMARGERARIARELHDVVAHHISMISVQAETARLTVAGLPPEGAARFREIGDTARAGLTEMRRLLGVLRSDVGADSVGERQPQPGLAQIASLIDTSRPSSGGRVRLIVSGTVTSFDPGVELAAYRIVQEALTNARRHAPGAAVDVELRYEAEGLFVRVRDNGPGPDSRGDRGSRVEGGSGGDGGSRADRGSGGDGHGLDSGGDGHGLLGMRERAATVGGTLRTGEAGGGGFVVEAELPTQTDDPRRATGHDRDPDPGHGRGHGRGHPRAGVS
jgi:signal transduction histidine kinase